VVVASDYVYRLGKRVWEVLAYLYSVGGSATVQELRDELGGEKTRKRNFVRRRISPVLGYRYSKDKDTGQERRLDIGKPLAEYDAASGVVTLLPDWLERLEEYRHATDEHGDSERQRQRYRRARKAYRNRDRTPADTQPSPLRGKDAMRPIVAERHREDAERYIEEERTKVGVTASVFLHDEMDGALGARYSDTAARWRNLHGGSESALQRAVRHGPFRFRRVHGELYIEPEREPKPERKLPPKVNGIYHHGPECDCWLCASEADEVVVS